MKSFSKLTFLAVLLSSIQAHARSVYLNGVDISNAKEHELENVSVQINEKGDVFIVAPQYSVNEESTFIPLSKLKKKNKDHGITHKQPGPLGGISALPLPPKVDETAEVNSDFPPPPNEATIEPQQPATISEKSKTSIEKAGEKQPTQPASE